MKRSDPIELKKLRSVLRVYLKESLSKKPDAKKIREFRSKVGQCLKEYNDTQTLLRQQQSSAKKVSMTAEQAKGYRQGEIDSNNGEVVPLDRLKGYYSPEYVQGYLQGVKKGKSGKLFGFLGKIGGAIGNVLKQPGIGNRLQ